MCYESLFDLITGRISVEGVTGPIGLSEAIGEAARSDDLLNLLYLAGFISINLGVMNLLPIPALDGGRSLVLLFEVITKKRIPQRIENAINGVALMLLLGLSVLVMFKDVITIINR
jgi:regulator of sigma E protease